jgi:hypothetical protein
MNALIINNILSYCNIHVTDKELNELKNYPKYLFDCSNIINLKSQIKNLVGSISNKYQTPGIYIFIHKSNHSKYVGSSSQLAIRLNGYIIKKYKSNGLFLPMLYKEGLSNFLLTIIPLNKSNVFKSEIILEQYYLLDPSFNLNTIKVSNNPSGSVSKSLYMYNRDKSILYYNSTKQIDFINNLNIHHTTILKHLKNKTYYLGKYLFSRELYLKAKNLNMSLIDLSLKLQNDRNIFNKNKPLNSLSRAIILEDIFDKNKVKLFLSLNKCIIFFKEKGFKVDQRMLVKCIKLNKPYLGYNCKYV